MARPKKQRHINCNPLSYYYKPRGVPMHSLEEIILESDELEAIRLGDLLNLSQEEAAERMKISRATFGRIVNKARAKIADCIINGKAIKISEDLPEALKNHLIFICQKCGFKAKMQPDKKIINCPKCNIQ